MNICPKCGHGFDDHKVIRKNGFAIDPLGVIRYKDARIKGLTRQSTKAVAIIASANGRPMTARAIADQITASKSDPASLLSHLLGLARERFGEAGAPWPISLVRGCGYFWEIEDAD